MKQTFYQVLIILCSAIVVSLLFNQIRDDSIKLVQIKSDELPLIANNNLGPQNDIREISIEKAYKRSGDEKVLFVDARSENDFEKRHIKDAVNLYEKNFDELIDDFFAVTEPETLIIAYCDGIYCSLGKELAEQLFSVGYNNVYYLVNGLTRWEEKNKMSDE